MLALNDRVELYSCFPPGDANLPPFKTRLYDRFLYSYIQHALFYHSLPPLHRLCTHFYQPVLRLGWREAADSVGGFIGVFLR